VVGDARLGQVFLQIAAAARAPALLAVMVIKGPKGRLVIAGVQFAVDEPMPCAMRS
jgi:hypothetical protein